MSDDMHILSPCPFCGEGETFIDESKTRASLLEPNEVISVYVKHRCGGFARGAQSAFIQVRGRNRSDAIAAWNRRVALDAQVMSDEKLAERIAQARWGYFTWIRGPHFGDPSWMDLSQDARDTLLNESRQILSAIKAAGLAVVKAEDGR